MTDAPDVRDSATEGPDEDRTAPPGRRPWPAARPSYASVAGRVGPDRAELVHEALLTGDRLADDLVEEMHRRGMAFVHRQFARAAAEGIEAVPDAGPALRALFRQVEATPGFVGDDLLDRGSTAFFTTATTVHTFSLTAGSLLRVYSAPSIALVLAGTGRLMDGAARRIHETGRWLYAAMESGAMRRGRAGYVATLQVRMMHAHMRRLARERGFDETVHGVAINQVDLARTWLDFTVTSLTAEERLGFDLTTAEQRDLYLYWQYIAHVLGVDRRLLADVGGHDDARRAYELLQAVTGDPVDASVDLARATLDAIAELLLAETGYPRWVSMPVLLALSRSAQGPQLADRLGLRRARVAELLLPVIVRVVRRQRRSRRRAPRAWAAGIERNRRVVRASLSSGTGARTAAR
ncbi:MAG: oxygenase MpaB family protein [Micrococcus sp.]|nr:oxygenase MpaB family protein [Micrococcus sp.]